MNKLLTAILLTLSAQGAPLLAQAQDTPTAPGLGCGMESAAPATSSRSADFTHRFDQAQVEGDFAQAIATLQDWDQHLLFENQTGARLEVAYHAYRLGHERHAAGDLDNAAMLLGHALEIHREVGGRDTYAVWHELAQLHLTARRYDFAQTYIAQALTRLASEGPEANAYRMAFQGLEGELAHRLAANGGNPVAEGATL